jgi:tetratricopeptide (TPR) repeat protein
MRRDYILLKMDEFARTMANITELKKEGKWDQAINIIGENLYRLLGMSSRDPREISKLTETGLLAQLIKNAPASTVWVPYNKIMLIALLKEAGDYTTNKFPPRGGRGWYLKALHLLLDALAHDELRGQAALVPQLEVFLTALSGSPLPVRTRLLLMREYERRGQFSHAKGELKAALEMAPKSLTLLKFGIALCERLDSENDASLVGGGMPRSELQALTSELFTRKGMCS